MFVTRVVNGVFGIIEAFLALRLLLRFLNANPAAPFVAWVYNITNGLVEPFFGSFPVVMLGGFALDLSTVFAIIVYSIIGWLAIRFLSFIAGSA